MKFSGHNFHKSSFLEWLASNFSAISYIIEFRKRNRKLFDIFVNAASVTICAMLLLVALILFGTIWGIIALILAIGCIAAWVYYQSQSRTKKRSRRKRPTRHFMRLINQGFRVYDGYFFHVGDCQGGDRPAKFSVLSRKHMNKKSMQKLMPVSNNYIGVVKNVNTNDCKYITFNGSDVYRFDSFTGNSEKTNDIRFEQNVARYFTTDR